MTARVEPPLYLTEAEVAKRLGFELREWVGKAVVLERKGFPRQDAEFGNRRYWPAVRAFLDRRAGLGQDAPLATDGEEDLDYVRHGRPRARAQGPAARV